MDSKFRTIVIFGLLRRDWMKILRLVICERKVETYQFIHKNRIRFPEFPEYTLNESELHITFEKELTKRVFEDKFCNFITYPISIYLESELTQEKILSKCVKSNITKL